MMSCHESSDELLLQQVEFLLKVSRGSSARVGGRVKSEGTSFIKTSRILTVKPQVNTHLMVQVQLSCDAKAARFFLVISGKSIYLHMLKQKLWWFPSSRGAPGGVFQLSGVCWKTPFALPFFTSSNFLEEPVGINILFLLTSL